MHQAAPKYIPYFNKPKTGYKKQQQYNAQVLIYGSWSFFTVDPRPLCPAVVPT